MYEIWIQFRKNRIATIALAIFLLYFLLGLYAPFLASSKPLAVFYKGNFYFPLFRYLFYRGFYSKPIDLFFNLLMFTLPLTLLVFLLFKRKRKAILLFMGGFQLVTFVILMFGVVKDPEREHLQPLQLGNWEQEVSGMNDYQKLNLLFRYRFSKSQEKKLSPYLERYKKIKPTSHVEEGLSPLKERLKQVIESNKNDYEKKLATLSELEKKYRPLAHELLLLRHDFAKNLGRELQEQDRSTLAHAKAASLALEKAKIAISEYKTSEAKLNYLEEKERWIKKEEKNLHILARPLIRPYHWEDDAGGSQSLNRFLPWHELTRVNRKDLTAALLFGIRISLLVGLITVAIALLIAIPLGSIAGYFAGSCDIVISRIIEIWEGMPAFFMLLLIVAIAQSKSIGLVILALGLFSWPHFARYMRGEVLKQRNLSYVLAGKALGFRHSRIMFSHILPNAIPPILTLLPFSMMAAITSEAGLSFLGLGEEGSTSWGVLMAEGRSVFPGESYLLWPPAILLTLLLISIALIGDGLRDALDPKMRK